MKLAGEPIESNLHVLHLSHSVRVLPLAQSCPAKIKTQHRKAEVVERLHGVEDDLIVQRSPIPGMGMADQGGIGGAFRALIQQAFQATRGAAEKQRANGGVLNHVEDSTLSKFVAVGQGSSGSRGQARSSHEVFSLPWILSA